MHLIALNGTFTPVCDSVHRGVLCPGMHHRSHDQGVSVQGVSVQGRVSVQGGFSVQGGLCPGGSLSGGSLPRGSMLGRPPSMVTSRWYASYWNAFLLFLDLLLACNLDMKRKA